MKVWMAAINTIGLPKDSPFRSVDRVSLPEDPKVGTQVTEQGEDNSDEDEGKENPKTRELSE